MSNLRAVLRTRSESVELDRKSAIDRWRGTRATQASRPAAVELPAEQDGRSSSAAARVISKDESIR